MHILLADVWDAVVHGKLCNTENVFDKPLRPSSAHTQHRLLLSALARAFSL